MAANTVTYDTAEIRRAARQIRDCAQSVANSAEPKLRSIRGEIPNSFRGKAADALSERLEDINSDVNTISSGLEALYRALMRYADALEEADRRMANSF